MKSYKPGEQLVISNMATEFVEIFNKINLLTHDNMPALSTGQFVYEWTSYASWETVSTGFTIKSEPISSTSEQYFGTITFYNPEEAIDLSFFQKYEDEIIRLQLK